MELKDLMELRSLENNGFSPYEQMKLQHMQSKSHTSGVGVAGLVTGIVGTIVGVGAWLFGGMYGNAKAAQAREVANSAKETANLLAASNQRQLDQLTNLLGAERNERLQGDLNITTTINDTLSGSQTGQLSASQIATNEATAQVMTGLMTGQYSQNPVRVVRVSGQRECGCDGCGGNGY